MSPDMHLKGYRLFMKFSILLVVILYVFTSLAMVWTIPLTGQPFDRVFQADNTMPTLDTFIETVISGESGNLAGVYVPEKFAYPIVQQPSESAGYVSSKEDVVTQFGMASRYNSTGLLAHNYLAGISFFELETGDYIDLVYDDGHVEYFWVYDILEYQALSPTDPYSNFIDLRDSNRVLSSTDVFLETYGKGVLVLQTCIEKQNEPSWGRLFVLAIPVSISELEQTPFYPAEMAFQAY